jgi:hypothetical protein
MFLALSISLGGCGISRDKCAVAILTDQLRDSPAAVSHATVYVSIDGEDADQATLDALRPLVASIRPGSQMPHLAPGATASDHWLYSVSSIHHDVADRYTAVAGFYCGWLCGATIEYQLKKDGHSCAVIGHRIVIQQ